MSYLGDRVAHDADAHIMEPPDWLVTNADPAWRDRMPLTFTDAALQPGEGRPSEMDRYRATHADPAYRADDEAQSASIARASASRPLVLVG